MSTDTGKKCLNCGRQHTAAKLFLLAAMNKEDNAADHDDEDVIGAIYSGVCPFCLARISFKKCGGALIKFLAGTLVINGLAQLISLVFDLAWIGGGILLVGLLIHFIRDVTKIFKSAPSAGAAQIAWKAYQKSGSIPIEDIVLPKDTPAALEKLPSGPNRPTLLDESMLEELKITDPIQHARYARIFYSVSQNIPSGESAGGKATYTAAVWYYITAFFTFLMTAFTTVLFLANALDGGSEVGKGIIGTLFGGLGVFGAILLLKTNRKGIAPLLLALAATITLFTINGEYSRDITSSLFTLALSIPILAILPQIRIITK